MTTLTDYRLITRDMPTSLKRVSQDKMVSRETDYYLANIGKIKTVEDFLKNNRLFNYAMKAHGLEDMNYAKGLMRKVLEGGADDEKALANKFTDPRYKQFAQAFDFKTHQGNATIFNIAQQGTVDKYLQQTLEEKAGANNQGVRLALYFERKIPEILKTNSTDKAVAFSILGDKALADVVRTALSIPAEMATANIDKQATMIIKKLNFDSLRKPEGLSKFMERFTALWEVKNSSSNLSPVVDLFNPRANIGLSADLIYSLNTLRLGGR